MNSHNKLNGGYVVLIIILLVCAALSISAFTMFVKNTERFVSKRVLGHSSDLTAPWTNGTYCKAVSGSCSKGTPPYAFINDSNTPDESESTCKRYIKKDCGGTGESVEGPCKRSGQRYGYLPDGTPCNIT